MKRQKSKEEAIRMAELAAEAIHKHDAITTYLKNTLRANLTIKKNWDEDQFKIEEGLLEIYTNFTYKKSNIINIETHEIFDPIKQTTIETKVLLHGGTRGTTKPLDMIDETTILQQITNRIDQIEEEHFENQLNQLACSYDIQ